MKIYPINIFNKIVNLPQNDYQTKQDPSVRAKNELISYSYSPVVFGADLNEFKSQMLSLDDIHCPCCGNKMVSKAKEKELIKQAMHTRNIKEYANFLEKNKEYFHPEYQRFIVYVNKFAQKDPNLPFADMVRILSSKTSIIMRNHIENQVNYLEQLSKSRFFSESDKAKLLAGADYLKSIENIPKYNDLKNNLQETIGKMDSEKKWKIYDDVKGDLHRIYKYNTALRYQDKNTLGLPLQAVIVSNMLHHSKSNYVEMSNTLRPDVRFNKFLLCNDCNLIYKSFGQIVRAENAKNNLSVYAADISKAISDRKLVNNSRYIYEFLSAVRGYTKGGIAIERSVMQSEAKNLIFKEGKSQYMFSKYEDIPCACCGTPMLTHDQKVDLYKQIIQSDSIHELMNLVKVNSKYINPRFENVLKRIERLLEENQNISENELLESMRKLSANDIRAQLEKNMLAVIDYQSNHKLNYIDNKLIDDYVAAIKREYRDFKDDDEFINTNFERIINDTLKQVSQTHQSKIVVLAKKNIRQLHVENHLLYPMPHVVEKVGGVFKAIFEDIFKGSVITVDHIEPRDSSGADEYFNKIGYCKSCNREKTNMEFRNWLKIHPEIRVNLPKHLRKISEIIKREKIKEMYDYPENLAKYSMELSKGRLRIPTKYDTKD